MVFLIPHPLLRHTHFLFNYVLFIQSLHNLGGVKCQPSLKCSGYYVADLTPLNFADSLEFSEPSCFVLFQTISIQKTELGFPVYKLC